MSRTNELTVKQVATAPPGRHGDGRGLHLLVKPSGARSWVLRIQVDNVRRDIGLGSVITSARSVSADVPLEMRRELTLAEARDKALLARLLVKAGRDPTVEWKRAATSTPTFERVARDFVALKADGLKNEKHKAQWLSTLQSYVFPIVGAKPVGSIGLDELEEVLKPIWLTIPETARRVRQRVFNVLHYAHSKGWLATLPSNDSLTHRLPAQPKKAGNFAALDYRHLPSFMADLRKAETTIGRLALEFAILTAGRSGEVRGARWSEIDEAEKTWTVPAGRMKAGKQHVVPLSDAALAVLEKAKPFAGGKDSLIFPGAKGEALSDMTLTKAMRGIRAGEHTVHGTARSSFRDWAGNEQISVGEGDDRKQIDRFARETIEFALAHVVGDKAEAAYRREMADGKRRVLADAWADYLATSK